MTRFDHYLNFLLLSFVLVSANLNAQAPTIKKDIHLSIATELLPPYQFVDAHGNITGYAVDFVEAILDDLGIQDKIQMYPWARTYKLATSRKNVLIFSIAKTPERESMFHWIGELHQERYSFFTLKTNEHIQVQSLEDAKAYNIAVTRSSVADHMLSKLGFTQLEKTDSFGQCLIMLIKKHSDLILASDYALNHKYTTRELSSDALKLIYNMDDIYSSGLFLAMSADSDPVIINKLRQSFKKLKDNGEMDRLKIKWDI